MTIGLVAARTGLRASAIRYYEAQGLLPVAVRKGGKRVYDASVWRCSCASLQDCSRAFADALAKYHAASRRGRGDKRLGL
jgi:hypothetical protein